MGKLVCNYFFKLSFIRMYTFNVINYCIQKVLCSAYKDFKIESRCCWNKLAVIEYAGEQVREDCLIFGE